MFDRPLDRRTLLRIGLGGGALLLLPAGCGDAPRGIGEPGFGRFFTLHEYETVQALSGLLIPEDGDPGAVSARVVDYVDFLLGAFTVVPPRIFAAGPYSGRHGGDNGFAIYLPLSRVKDIAWRTTIEGSRGIPEREFNGPVVGLQEIYRDGVAALDALAREQFAREFKDLPAEVQAEALDLTDPAFIDVVFQHVVEGMYAAPEYGGNADLEGWTYIGYEGDRQPLGYDRRAVEEPDATSGELGPEQLARAAAAVRQFVGLGTGKPPDSPARHRRGGGER